MLHSGRPTSNVMGLFDDLVRRLRPPAPAAEDALKPPPPPPALAELHELLDRLMIDRAAAEATILEAPFQRDALLDQPGTDKAIRKVDADVDAAHLLIERLDRLRPELDAKIAAAAVATRADAWAEMRSRLVEKIIATRTIMRLGEISYLQLCELRLEAQRCGFVEETVMMPYHADANRVNSGVLDQTATHIANRALIVPRTDQILWNVRFTAWTSMHQGTPYWTGYQEGQEAGFDAVTAWQLVDAGKAEWTGKLRPPRPRVKRRRPAPATAAQLENVAGRAPTLPATPVEE